MKIIQENPVFFDIDETLVLAESNIWDLKRPYAKYVDVIDPLDSVKTISMRIHEPMVRLLKEEKARGSRVIVWSRGGWHWARNVIEALQLDNYVDEVMTKPLVYFDDLDISEWLKYRVYLHPDTPYKKVNNE